MAGSRQEMIDKMMSLYPAAKRTCDLVFSKGGCIAYSETSEQTRTNAGIDVLIDHSLFPESARREKSGYCKATGTIVQCGAKCGVGDKRLRTWLKTDLFPPSNSISNDPSAGK